MKPIDFQFSLSIDKEFCCTYNSTEAHSVKVKMRFAPKMPDSMDRTNDPGENVRRIGRKKGARVDGEMCIVWPGEIVTYGIHLWASSIRRRSTARSCTNDHAHMHTHTYRRKEPHKRVPRRRWGWTVIILEPLPSRLIGALLSEPSRAPRREVNCCPFLVQQCTSFDTWRTCVNWARLSPTRTTDRERNSFTFDRVLDDADIIENIFVSFYFHFATV